MALVELVLVLTLAQASQAPDAASFTFSKPAQIAALDMGRLKGEPTKLAWSPDASQLYLQTTETNRNGSRTERHYVLPAAGGQPQSRDAMPDWAGKYWAWKSNQAAPGAPSFKIELADEQKTVRATAAPMGGDLARGGSGGTDGTTLADATGAAAQAQIVRVITLKLLGETVGEFTNGPLVPGLTFGWAPEALGVIAYANKDGKIVVMDAAGRKNEVAGASDALLPAWSDDGTRLAFLKRDGRRKYVVVTAGVTR
jgi:hypothetical protein